MQSAFTETFNGSFATTALANIGSALLLKAAWSSNIGAPTLSLLCCRLRGYLRNVVRN